MYIYLAIFWLTLGVLLRIFSDDVNAFFQTRRNVVDPNIVSFVCLVLFFYNIVRWRMSRAMRQAQQEEREEQEERTERRHPHHDQKPDPTFDFSDDDKKAK